MFSVAARAACAFLPVSLCTHPSGTRHRFGRSLGGNEQSTYLLMEKELARAHLVPGTFGKHVPVCETIAHCNIYQHANTCAGARIEELSADGLSACFEC